MADTAKVDTEVRKIREQARKLTIASLGGLQGFATLTTAAPSITVYDLKTTKVLPGKPVAIPNTSNDSTVARAFDVTTEVAAFYRQAFGRSSIDDAGMTLQSSVHYGKDYMNAFWNGFQMSYGDGDGKVFVDFTRGDDVVCHELTHGVTQYSLQLVYTNESGGLNESISDVFGIMFSQWRASNAGKPTSWLLGKDVMGPLARSKGRTCLRDMSDPDPKAAHCLLPQAKHYGDFRKGMDPHESSGIPNNAFYKAATAIGGDIWDKPGKIWYDALTGAGPSPNMTMKEFADATRASTGKLYGNEAATQKAVDDAWQAVGL